MFSGKYISLIFCISAVLSSCSSSQFKDRDFPYVKVPSMIASGKDAAAYTATYFWDGFTDTSCIFPDDSGHVNGVRKEDLEKAFSEYSDILWGLGIGEARTAVSRLCERAGAFDAADTASSMLETLCGLAEKYLYDPNSPFRNEDLYLPVAEFLAEYDGVGPEMREAYRHTARMCLLNPIGQKAADFRFSDAGGQIYTLYGIDAEYTLLFFSNPGCEACRSITEALEGSGTDSLTASGTLAVVNVYIDEDVPSWYSYRKEYPQSWYNGYDPDHAIRSDTLYNVRAIPSLYILDKDKNVLMKDAPEGKVIGFLTSLSRRRTQSLH